MKTRLMIGALLIFVIVFSFAGLAGAQIQGVPYVPPPVPPDITPVPPPTGITPDVDDPFPTVPAPPVDEPVDLPPMPPTAGGMLQAYGMLIGLVLLGSALPLRRR